MTAWIVKMRGVEKEVLIHGDWLDTRPYGYEIWQEGPPPGCRWAAPLAVVQYVQISETAT